MCQSARTCHVSMRLNSIKQPEMMTKNQVFSQKYTLASLRNYFRQNDVVMIHLLFVMLSTFCRGYLPRVSTFIFLEELCKKPV